MMNIDNLRFEIIELMDDPSTLEKLSRIRRRAHVAARARKTSGKDRSKIKAARKQSRTTRKG